MKSNLIGFHKKGKIWTQRHMHKGRISCEDEGRDLWDASTSQGMSNHQKLGERHGTDCPHSPHGTSPAHTLISDV